MRNLKEFIVTYKKVMYKNGGNKEIKELDIDILIEKFNTLNNTDKKYIITIVLNDLKNTSVAPLTKRQITSLKYINTKELIILKIWLSKVAIILTATGLILYGAIEVIKKIPVLKKNLVILNELENTTHILNSNEFKDDKRY